jgi:LEA14-like dessication related protein
LRRRLDGLGLRENEVDGDGNCQFRAIADQLYGSPDRDAEVRADIVEHLRSNSARYSAFVPESYDAYIEDMGLDGNWGDHVTLQAASNVYGLEIRVYTSYDRNWERVIRPTDDGNIRRAIQLSFYAELHYNSVHPITNEGQNPGRDVKDVLERRSRDRGEGLSTLTPRVNDNSTLNRVLRESARQSPERQLLRRRLDGLGLRENEVDGDGNCQFRAIADQLYGSPDRYADVRTDIVEHLRSNVPLYSGFVHGIQYDAYIEKMGRDGNWGDHLTLQAASNVYGLEIRVYTSYDENWERVIRPTDDGNIRRAIQLSFYAELHYNSVHPMTNEEFFFGSTATHLFTSLQGTKSKGAHIFDTRSCSKCPKSAGPERCQYCSPENFCCVPEHGNSYSCVTDKVMCPECSPNNFCRDPKHGNSEDDPAHKSSCRKCSHDYFNNVSNEQVSGREGGNVGYQRVGYQWHNENKKRARGGKCTRCLRDTHYANKCYAKTDINGFLLY